MMFEQNIWGLCNCRHRQLFSKRDCFKFCKSPSFNWSILSTYLPMPFDFSKMGQSQPLFCLFLSFSHYHFNNTHWKKCRWCDGIQTRGHRMVGANESTELWRPSTLPTYYAVRFLFKSDNCFDAFLKNRVKHIAGLTSKSICREKIKVNMKGKVFLSAGWWR